MPVQIFLSAVTDEFGRHRESLRRDLDRPDVTVKIQEDFIASGVETLAKLDDYIRQCDAVIHLVGDMPGAPAHARSVRWLAARYPDFGRRLPVLVPFLAEDGASLSYTQWEAWLALYHGKPLVIAVPEGGLQDGSAAQREHLSRLAGIERYPEVRFASADRLAVEVLRSKLQDLLRAASGSARGLEPWDFQLLVAERREGFEGRAWLFEEVARWLRADHPRALLIRADFGVGKSAFAAELVHRDPGGDVAAWHFCDHGTRETLDPGVFVRSLAACLAARLPGYARQLAAQPSLQDLLHGAAADPGSALEGAVLTPLARLQGPPRRRLLLVDALDEALELDAEAIRRGGTIVDLLARKAARFPPWLRLLATTRPHPAVVTALQRAFGIRDVDAESAGNRDDLRRHVLSRAAREPLATCLRQGPHDAAALAELLLERSQGKFLYAALALRDLELGHVGVGDLAALPPGMDSFYGDAFDRRFARGDIDDGTARGVLGVLAAAREPLAVPTVADVLDTTVARVAAVQRLLPDFLRLRAGTLAFSHFSLAEWLTGLDENGLARAGAHAVELEAWRRHWRAWALREVGAGRAHACGYLLRHLAAHLAGPDERRSVFGGLLLRSFDWFAARFAQGGVEGLLEDAVHLRGLPEQAPLQAVLRSAGYVLRAHPGQLAAQLTGRIGGGFGPERLLGALAEAARRTLAEPAAAGREKPLVPMSRSLRSAEAGVATFQGVGGAVLSMALLPGGCVAFGGTDGTVRVWDPLRGIEPVPLTGHTAPITAMAALPDGRVASAADDRTVRVWTPDAQAPPIVLEGHTNEIYALLPLGDGRLASGDEDGIVRVWPLAPGSTPAVLALGGAGVASLEILRDGRLACGTRDGAVHVVEPRAGALPAVLGRHDHGVQALLALPDGRLASGGGDGQVRLWAPEGGTPPVVLAGHAGAVRALALLTDGRLASASNDATVRVWELRRPGAPAVLEGHVHPVFALAALPGGALASGGADGTVRVWTARPGAEPIVFEGHPGLVTALGVLPGARIAAGSGDGTVRVWDPLRADASHRCAGHRSRVQDLRVRADGRIVSCSIDSVRVWDPRRPAAPEVFQGAPGHWLALLTDCCMASCEMDGPVRLRDFERGAEVAATAGALGWPMFIVALPDGRVATSDEGLLQAWDPARAAGPVASCADEIDALVAVALPDGRVAMGGSGATVHLWDPGSGHRATLRADDVPGNVKALAPLPGGGIACGTSRGAVYAWPPGAAAPDVLLEGPGSSVRALAALPGERLAVGSDDGGVRLWHAPGRALLGAFFADAAVTVLAVAPGELIVAGCDDGTVHFLREAGVGFMHA